MRGGLLERLSEGVRQQQRAGKTQVGLVLVARLAVASSPARRGIAQGRERINDAHPILREAALELGYVSAEQFDAIVRPDSMTESTR